MGSFVIFLVMRDIAVFLALLGVAASMPDTTLDMDKALKQNAYILLSSGRITDFSNDTFKWADEEVMGLEERNDEIFRTCLSDVVSGAAGNQYRKIYCVKYPESRICKKHQVTAKAIVLPGLDRVFLILRAIENIDAI